MLYYTQFIFIKENEELAFQQFEDGVLPLLERHRGRLLYRVRPPAEAVLETGVGLPYEVHLVSFESTADFESYRDDPDRLQYVPLKEQSVRQAILIEGAMLGSAAWPV